MKRNYLVLIPMIFLSLISIYFLPTDLKYKQFFWLFLGIILFFIISNIKFNKLLKYSFIYYLIGILLLILVLLLNKFTNGSRGWITLGFISFQPSEIMKICLILLTIKYYEKLNVLLLVLIYIIPMILIFLEPDTGGVISELIILIYFITKKINTRQIIKYSILCLIILFLLIGIYMYNKDILINIFGTSLFYRLDRITSFINDNNLQTTNAIISIATGKLLYFPEMYNDFYISYILCNNIYLIIPIISSTIVILILIKIKNTLVAQVSFYLIFWHCIYNLAMNLKLVPVIGIPYLFISYGGSSLVSTYILIGIICNKDYNHKSYCKALDKD